MRAVDFAYGAVGGLWRCTREELRLSRVAAIDRFGGNANTGSQGSLQVFFDGNAQTAPVGINDSCWANGLYIFPGWVQNTTVGFFGGVGVDSSTSNNDPMFVKYVRVWQAK